MSSRVPHRGAAVVYRSQLPQDTPGSTAAHVANKVKDSGSDDKVNMVEVNASAATVTPGVTSSLCTVSAETSDANVPLAAASSAASLGAAVTTPGVAAKLPEMEIFFEVEPAPAAPESVGAKTRPYWLSVTAVLSMVMMMFCATTEHHYHHHHYHRDHHDLFLLHHHQTRMTKTRTASRTSMIAWPG